jgi:hypothetical protein
LEHLHHSFVEWVEAQNCPELSLSLIISECVTRWPELAGCDDATIEALLALWPEVEIRRDSIFEARLLVMTLRDVGVAQAHANQEEAPSELTRSTARKVVRERRIGSKKRAPQESSQQNLWE